MFHGFRELSKFLKRTFFNFCSFTSLHIFLSFLTFFAPVFDLGRQKCYIFIEFQSKCQHSARFILFLIVNTFDITTKFDFPLLSFSGVLLWTLFTFAPSRCSCICAFWKWRIGKAISWKRKPKSPSRLTWWFPINTSNSNEDLARDWWAMLLGKKTKKT